MSLKLAFTEERRIVLGIPFRRFEILRGTNGKYYAFSLTGRIDFLLARWYLKFIFFLLCYRPMLTRQYWSIPPVNESKQRKKDMEIYSERLHVIFLQLKERVTISRDASRKIVPRHQDRGSEDAVSHNDNLEEVLIHTVTAICNN